MERSKEKLRNNIINNNEGEVQEALNAGLDPNLEGGWPIRLAARYGLYSMVKLFILYGANPHILSEAGASTLQLAVFSGLHWDTENWTFLLSCCDSSQLADGAAVAIIFNNVQGLLKILDTGRCNTNIPTSLTGKTVEDLAKGYKLHYLLNSPVNNNLLQASASPISRRPRTDVRNANHSHRNLSPSVARFFDLTSRQPSLTPPHSPRSVLSSTNTARLLN
ncbi:uncharacterized protein LOC116779810 [Danaus plexippus]|uniref:Uncharacterized protein n=1 Tax=Danaus plexippus plexippus TaxID=278856 RepID=A0A212F0R3_DANPL|nr:uncharacterized protein LOC116779810 [Danaus plexippus]OWR47320.1 hypothetical protein KGM_214150 [Danaus plexippus plexippus]